MKIKLSFEDRTISSRVYIKMETKDHFFSQRMFAITAILGLFYIVQRLKYREEGGPTSKLLWIPSN